MPGAPSTTQFLHSIQSSDAPIFGRRKINHQPPHPVTHVVASAKRVVLVLQNKSIQRVDQSRPDGRVETIDLSKTSGGDRNGSSLTRSCKVSGQILIGPKRTRKQQMLFNFWDGGPWVVRLNLTSLSCLKAQKR